MYISVLICLYDSVQDECCDRLEIPYKSTVQVRHNRFAKVVLQKTKHYRQCGTKSKNSGTPPKHQSKHVIGTVALRRNAVATASTPSLHPPTIISSIICREIQHKHHCRGNAPVQDARSNHCPPKTPHLFALPWWTTQISCRHASNALSPCAFRTLGTYTLMRSLRQYCTCGERCPTEMGGT